MKHSLHVAAVIGLASFAAPAVAQAPATTTAPATGTTTTTAPAGTMTTAPAGTMTTAPVGTTTAAPSTGTAPAAVSSSNNPRTTAAPVAGANSFTEGQAKSRIEEKGFGNVTELKKDDQGVWRATAMKDGKSVSVALDYQGNVVAN